MPLHKWTLLSWGFVIGTSWVVQDACAVPPPAVKDTMFFSPKQKDVEYEIPKPDEYSKCKLEVDRKDKGSGWVVLGPAGQILRKFVDLDGDGKVDQWRYFNHGIEVYRDIDTNGNNKPDQARWLNLGGSRWGIDQNEDGRIDSWKILSAAEASQVAIRAMIAGDDAALQSVMVTSEDLQTVRLDPALGTKLLESSREAGKKSRAVLGKSKVLTAKTRWTRFDAQIPSVIPADDGKANGDLYVFENAMAIVETQEKFDAVQIGEMIRIGEVWKLTQVPLPIEGGKEQVVTAGGVLMQPLSASSGGIVANGGASPEVEKLLGDLGKIEQEMMQPQTDRVKIKGLMTRRGELLNRAIALAESDDDRLLLMKQLVDGFALTSQMGNYPDGAAELKSMESDQRRLKPKSTLVPYVAYRRLQAQYSVEMQESDNDKDKVAEIQKQWITGLEGFIGEFPDADDTAEAMRLLAQHEELNVRPKEAVAWYQRLAKEKPKSEAGQFAIGAMRRIELKGKPLTLFGPTNIGGTIDIRNLRSKAKAVLVVYWGSEYKVCEEDLPQLRSLYKDNRAKGLEIIGVCLDMQKTTITPYLTTHQMTWPQIHESGGLSSPMAIGYGIFSLPTMFLVDREGLVVSRNATVQDVKTLLPTLLK
jgi:peroxiredoxin